MKHLFFIVGMLLMLNSCKKESIEKEKQFFNFETLKKQLSDSLSRSEMQQLNFNSAIITRYADTGYSLLRIPFLNKNIATDFVLLKIEKSGSFSLGKVINLRRNQQQPYIKQNSNFEGEINIHFLNGKLVLKSAIINGYIEAYHPKKLDNSVLKEAVVPVPLLPEVVLFSTYSQNGAWDFSNWYNLSSFLDPFSNGYNNTGDYYSSSSPLDYIEYGNINAAPFEDHAVLIDYEPVEDLSPINLKEYVRCFNDVPDAGAVCTIKILTDIPVDKDPNAFFNWDNGSPGHTFLQITKVNGSQSVQQNIGFYPVSGWKSTLTPAPTPGKFVDNDDHEFNASLTMNLTPEQLQSTLIHMQYLANFIQYDIDEFNCTDFALNVFNYRRGGNQLTIPMYDIPGGTAAGGTATPQGLYQKLSSMKKQGTNESNNIIIPGVKGFVGSSNGPCN
ncbi:MAG: hypothetical protein ABIN01_01280 [Ferruginibacter sp.]